VNFPRDFQSSHVGDFAKADNGHKSIGSSSRLKLVKGIEIGNIFKLGTKFSSSMKAEFLDHKGLSNPIVMGCYGIGIGRLMAAVVENCHDEFGPIWPKEIAPYQVHLLNIGNDKDIIKACDKLYHDLQENGFQVLYDDRDERPGVKFKDADLWGIPVRIGISRKTLDAVSCEMKMRQAKKPEIIPFEEVFSRLNLFYQDTD
jgi:prolyl-tRNA synthetase